MVKSFSTSASWCRRRVRFRRLGEETYHCRVCHDQMLILVYSPYRRRPQRHFGVFGNVLM